MASSPTFVSQRRESAPSVVTQRNCKRREKRKILKIFTVRGNTNETIRKKSAKWATMCFRASARRNAQHRQVGLLTVDSSRLINSLLSSYPPNTPARWYTTQFTWETTKKWFGRVSLKLNLNLWQFCWIFFSCANWCPFCFVQQQLESACKPIRRVI